MTEIAKYVRFNKKWVSIFAVLSLLYWMWFGLIIGVDELNFVFYLLFIILAFGTFGSRKVFVVFSPFFIYLLFYSSLKVLHKYNVFEIRIQELYDLEKSFFGFTYNGKVITANEYFLEHMNVFSDLFAGASYFTWVPFPVLFVFYFIYKKRPEIGFQYWIAFLIANLLGFIGYITYPAAPPWYFLEYGNQLIVDLKGNAAGLERFDDLLGISLYKGMYSEGTNTFGAVPSMHAAFPMMLTYFSMKFGRKWLTLLAFISMIGIWYGAVYTSHHYILDIILGIVCGIIALIATESLINRKFVFKWYDSAMNFIKA
jgi:hypothetical protein